MNLPAAGALYKKDQTHFRVWAPLKKQMDLWVESEPGAPDAGIYPRQFAMARTAGGYFETTLPVAPGARYRFSPDGEGPFPDPASRFQPEGVHGPSEVVDPLQFTWKDNSWTGIARGDLIISEIHTGTFSDKHNFAGIRGRLDYLKNAGFNAIELMPVAAFPGSRNWGYDGVFPFAVQESYGGPDELKNLVNEAHSKGIAVLLDVVYNHLGPDGNYLGCFGPYFTDKYKLFWGASLNFDDAWSDGVRAYFITNALQWLDEFHIDGLRLDAVHAYKDSSARHFVQALKESVAELEKNAGIPKILIAEIDLNDARYLRAPELGGYGLDGQWVDEFHHALHSLLTGEKAGYYEDFGDTDHLVKAYRETYVYNGNYSVHRKRAFGSDATPFDYDRFVVFAQNHDQTGNRLEGDRLATLVSFEALKLAAAAVMLSPYVPLFFMGEEYGEKRPFLFFVDHTDAALLEAVRKGRREEFAYFNHSGDFPDPASEESFQRSTLSWDYSSPERAALLRWHAWLAGRRQALPALRNKKRSGLAVDKVQEKIIVLRRSPAAEGQALFALFNFAAEAVTLAAPPAPGLVCLTNSAGSLWAGGEPDRESQAWSAGQSFSFPPFSATLFLQA